MKKKILAVLVGAPLLALAIVPAARSQTSDSAFKRFFTAKPTVVDQAVTANFASSVTRFFPAATSNVAAVFKEATDNPAAFNKDFVFKAETPFTVTVESSVGRANVHTTFKDFQDAVFSIVPKDQQLFVASTFMGMATGFKDACVFMRFGPDGKIMFVGVENTAFSPSEVSTSPHGTISASMMTADVAARFAKALNGKAFNANYGIEAEDVVEQAR